MSGTISAAGIIRPAASSTTVLMLDAPRKWGKALSSSIAAEQRSSLDPAFMAGPRCRAQLVLADLAGGGSGQVEHEVNVLGRLELRDLLLDMVDQFRLPRGLSRGQHHEGLR